MNLILTDGGRSGAGFKGTTGDCVTRAVAVATGLPYQEAYDLVNRHCAESGVKKAGSARTGVAKDVTRTLFASLGFMWVPLMGIGTGCKVHLRADELPAGTLVVKLSSHVAVVKNGVLFDNHDSRREGTRCVYGYWLRAE